MMTIYALDRIHSAADLRTVADATGGFFFSRETMRFFDSRLIDYLRPLDGNDTLDGARFLFITSERCGDYAPRQYRVRIATLTTREGRASVRFDTLTIRDSNRAARKAADRMARIHASISGMS